VQPAWRRQRTSSCFVAQVLPHAGHDGRLVVASTLTEPGVICRARVGMIVLSRPAFEHFHPDRMMPLPPGQTQAGWMKALPVP
jgi:hypothetical protein